jgi:hypothetical protein
VGELPQLCLAAASAKSVPAISTSSSSFNKALLLLPLPPAAAATTAASGLPGPVLLPTPAALKLKVLGVVVIVKQGGIRKVIVSVVISDINIILIPPVHEPGSTSRAKGGEYLTSWSGKLHERSTKAIDESSGCKVIWLQCKVNAGQCKSQHW